MLGHSYKILPKGILAYLYIALLFLPITGCAKKENSETSNKSQAEKLVLITPHNENIKYEFEQAFNDAFKAKTGKEVTFEWRDVGGGSSSILNYLRNVYTNADTSGIDILFGGGEYPFQYLDHENLLEPLTLSDDVLANIPATFGGMDMYSKNKTWVGNVLSSFGFLYNKNLLQQLSIDPPQKWEDLGKADFYDLVILADPTQSGSIAAAYEMIVQSAPDWNSGWAELFMILSNAKKFTDSSGTAANAPVTGEAVVSVCIDFYGNMRVAKSPNALGYVSPKGQTGFTPDPIAILKNPPNPEVAKAFVDFILSFEGQRLWALEPTNPDGPKRYALNRTPIRKDFYDRYENDIPAGIARPYADGAEMIVDAELREVRYGILAQLVRAAAIDNLDLMKKAKKKIIDSDYDPALIETFTKLPDNIDTEQELRDLVEKIKDPVQQEVILTDWTTFFKNQYKKIL